MTVAISRATASPFHLDNTNSSPLGHTSYAGSDHVDIWSQIESQNPIGPPAVAEPYIHPLVRRSWMSMSHKSLEICTESLGSETGINDFDDKGWFSMSSAYMANEKTSHQEDFYEVINGRRELQSSVNNHYTGGRSLPHSFPPPLPSTSSRDGPCIQMRPHRLDGRLVVMAIPLPLQNYLNAHRHEGRLVLSFFATTTSQQSGSTGFSSTMAQAQHQYTNYKEQVKKPKEVNFGDVDDELDEDEVEEEKEREVEDRVTVVEVKVSTLPEKQVGNINVLR